MKSIPYRVKMHLIAEIVVCSPNCNAAADAARRKLDAFRESTQPSADYGITIYEDTSTPELDQEAS